MQALLDNLEAMARAPRKEDGATSPRHLAEVFDVVEVCDEIKRLALRDLARAVALSEALESLTGESDPDLHHVLAARGHVLCYAGRLNEALSCLDRASRAAARDGTARDVGLVELASVQALARLGSLDAALDAAQRAAAALEASNDQFALGKALLNAGIVLRMMGRPEDALARFDASLPKLASDDLTAGAVTSNRAEALLDLDRFEEASASFHAALERFEAGGHAHAAAIVAGNLADLRSRQGRLDEAVSGFERARALYESCGARADAARLAAEQGEAFEAAGAIGPAMRAYAEALGVLDGASLAREAARARAGLGRAMLGHGLIQEGCTVLAQAASALTDVGASDSAAECAALLTTARIRAGACAEIEPGGLKDRPARLARARAEVAEALLDVGRLDEAEHLIETLASTRETWSNRPLEARVSHARGRALSARGRLDEAMREMHHAMMLAESVREALRADVLRSSWGESRRAVYQDCASACLDVGGVKGLAGAFEAIERLRCGSSRGRCSRAHDNSGPDAAVKIALSRELASITEELNVRYADLSGRGSARGGHAELLARIADLERLAERVRDRLDAMGDSWRGASQARSIDQVRARLTDDSLGVSFFREGAAISAFVVGRMHVRAARRIAEETEVRRALRRVRFCVERLLEGGSTRDEAGLEAALRRLAALILSPLEARGIRRLFISAPAWLEEAPWAVMPHEGGLLVDHVAASHVRGLSTITQDRKRIDGRVLAVGVADERAPLMEEEARAAAGREGVVLTGTSATASALLEAVESCASAHLATHCVYSPLFPLSSRVRMYDRWVTAREIAEHVRSGCELTLASCESGRPGVADDEGSHGLIGALLDAGVGAAAASRWRLHDATALAMFARVHARRDEDLAEAVANAQREARAGGEASWRWGGVFVTGGNGS